jgi:hypothetical protein
MKVRVLLPGTPQVDGLVAGYCVIGGIKLRMLAGED